MTQKGILLFYFVLFNLKLDSLLFRLNNYAIMSLPPSHMFLSTIEQARNWFKREVGGESKGEAVRKCYSLIEDLDIICLPLEVRNSVVSLVIIMDETSPVIVVTYLVLLEKSSALFSYYYFFKALFILVSNWNSFPIYCSVRVWQAPESIRESLIFLN